MKKKTKSQIESELFTCPKCKEAISYNNSLHEINDGWYEYVCTNCYADIVDYVYESMR